MATGETKHLFCTRELKPARLPVKHRALFEQQGREAGQRDFRAWLTHSESDIMESEL